MGGSARVGPYRILRLVNRGGQGSVYLGYDKRLRRRVAIKIYPLPEERKARRQLLREAQLVASIQSPKVVQIHDVIESSEHLALVMEYVPGCDLEEFLGAVRPSLVSILTIATDIAGALAAARQQHIVHGDLKARNVLVAENGRVKLTDFGIAVRPASPAGPVGSASCVSPEQYLGKPLDERSDLFALGCLLYRMLSGVQPFFREGHHDADLLLEGAPLPLEEAVPLGVDIPRELVDLVMALLQKDPADRPSGTRLVRQVLRRVARAIPLSATNSLQAEARPCFRPESAEDIPPDVPAGLGRDGRSHINVAVRRGLPGLVRRRWPAILAVLAAAAMLFFILPGGHTRVHIDAPVLRIAADAELPDDVSGHWLVAEVIEAVGERLGPLQVTGPVGAIPATTLYTAAAMRSPPEPATEQVRLDLRCVNLLCVFAVTRRWEGQQANRQAVLFPDMSAEQWRSIVRTTTQALYP